MSSIAEILAKAKEKKLDTRKPEMPATTLAEKAGGFKFKLPSGNANEVEKAAEKANGKEVANTVLSSKPSVQQQSPDASSERRESNVGGQQNTQNADEATGLAKYEHDSQLESVPQDSVEEYKKHLQNLENAFGQPEQIASAVDNIMAYLQSHAELRDILRPKDIGTMVRALRERYGITVQRKQTNKTKRQSTQKKSEEIMDEIADLDISL